MPHVNIKDLSTDKLKVMVYDIINDMQRMQNNLNALNAEIDERQAQGQKPKIKEDEQCQTTQTKEKSLVKPPKKQEKKSQKVK